MTTVALPVSVRGWFPPPDKPYRPTLTRDPVGPSEWVFVFDTETTTDQAQSLRFGTWQAYHSDLLIRQGVFYDPDGVTDTELDLLKSEAATRSWECHTHAEWIIEVFLPYAVDRSATVVGHNLAFDISRIAIGHETTRSRDNKMRGGLSYKLVDDPQRPRMLVKRASATATFIQFTVPDSRTPEQRASKARGEEVPPFRGFFVDTSALAAALLGRRYKLRELAEALQTKHRKQEADLHGPITVEFLDYAMGDVTVTWECFVELRDRYMRYGLDKPMHRIVSQASIGKAHLEQMRLTPWRRAQPDFPDWLISAVMETYYGGRCECRIRRTPTPGVYVDFLSQYPTVYALQNLWAFQVAQHITHQEDDPAEVMAWIDDLPIDDILDRDLWSQLTCIVEIDPDGDLLVTRAPFNPNAKVENVGVAYRDPGDITQWWTLADAIASKLETGKTPTIRRAIRFLPGPVQSGLRDIQIAGRGDFTINPYETDFIQRIIELRVEAKQEKKKADANGDTTTSGLWDGIQNGLKITANSVSYGIGIELNTTDHRSPVTRHLHHPDGKVEELRTKTSEEPGSWFNPSIGTFSAAGGRLILASLIAQVRQRGGSYVFGDTDSLFIAATEDGRTVTFIAPDGTVHPTPTLTWDDVNEIVDSYRSLNPYSPEAVRDSILELEDINCDRSGSQREIHAYSIASKRYALFTLESDGTYRLARDPDGKPKRSEHGLGHLVAPIQNWEDQLWEYLANTDSGHDWPEPEWFDLPALGQITINTPHDAALFKHLNRGLDYREQTRPGGFLTTAHPHPLEEPGLLIAPKTNHQEALAIDTWANRNTGATGFTIRTDRPECVIEGSVAVLDYRHYVLQYLTHPEWKTADPRATGALLPRSVAAASIGRIGKEGPILSEPIAPSRRCQGCGVVLNGRQQTWCGERCRKSVRRGSGD